MFTRIATNRTVQIVLLYFVIIGAVLLLADFISQSNRIAFNTQPLTDLLTKKPSFIFIGDSMLETRIDEATFEQVSGEKTTVLFRGGSASAQWYLMYKNYVIESGIAPKKVVILFRDTYLTDADFRTTGKYALAIESLRTNNEITFDGIIQRQNRSFFEKTTELFAEVGSIYDVQDSYQKSVNALGTKLVTRKDPERFSQEVDNKFQLDQLRLATDDDTGGMVQPEQYVFAGRVTNSFLPEMISLAQQHEQTILFVRVKRRPASDGVTPQSPELIQYIADLKQYLNQQNMEYYDFTDDTTQTVDLYRDGDHIKDAVAHTQYFYDKLKPFFKWFFIVGSLCSFL